MGEVLESGLKEEREQLNDQLKDVLAKNEKLEEKGKLDAEDAANMKETDEKLKKAIRDLNGETELTREDKMKTDEIERLTNEKKVLESGLKEEREQLNDQL